jgi:hypothetical protein
LRTSFLKLLTPIQKLENSISLELEEWGIGKRKEFANSISPTTP